MHTINMVFPNSGTRNEVRGRVIDTFQLEEPGTGKGDNSSKYRYYVEETAQGESIYLSRPTNLNKGFDFTVCCENTYFARTGQRRIRRPSHPIIIQDLETKKAEDGAMYEALFGRIQQVFNCEEIHGLWFEQLRFTSGVDVELIVKCIKWLFIEQDVTYWNYSGRAMLMSGIPLP